MGLLNKFFGYRWSLYIVANGNKLIYAMHENSVIRILGYVVGYYEGGAAPLEPWSLHLNFNHKHKSILLKPEHFKSDGGNVTILLMKEIERIDPGWQVKGDTPVFEEAGTKKRLEINGSTRNPTFYTVMDDIFGRS